MSRDWRLYLDDMLEACRRVVLYQQGLDLERFIGTPIAYDAILHNLEVLGEAAKKIPQPVRERYATIEWRKIAGLRDFIAHAYFGLDEEILWDVVSRKVPALLPQLQAIHRSEAAR